MELNFSEKIDRQEWDRYIASQASGSFLQSYDWGEWIKSNGNPVMRLTVGDRAGRILMGAQIIRTHIPKLGGHYIYIPYGPVLAPHAAADAVTFFFKVVKQRFPSAMFVRIEPKQQLPVLGRPTLHIQPGKTLVLDLNQSEDRLLAEMHHKTRYNIKVAQRHGVKVTVGDNTDEALRLIEQTSRRQGFKSHPLSYYEQMVKFFATENQNLKLKVYTASHNEKVLAAAIMVDFGPTRTYLFGGTSDAERNVMAPYSLHWTAIQDAKATGMSQYDFWGIETASGATPGFVRFKLGWGGQELNYAAPTDIVYKPLWYNAYKLLRTLNRKF